MAKKGGKSKGFISQGVHSNVKPTVLNNIRREYMESADRVINQLNALTKGKDVVMTIANPNKEQTNKKFIRVKVSGKAYTESLKENRKMAIQKEAA